MATRLNCYLDLDSWRRRQVDNQALDIQDQLEALRTIEAASRQVDSHCGRHFYVKTETRYFDGSGKIQLSLQDDLLAVTSIKLDEDGDLTYELTLTVNTDYFLRDPDAIDRSEYSPPYSMIELNYVTGQRSVFMPRHRLIEIAGRWGYTEQAEAVSGITVTLNDASTTAMTSSGAGDLAIGQTLLVESEQVAIQAGSGTSWTVTRAVNGTTGAAHAAKAASRFMYHPDVIEATQIQAAMLWKRRDLPLGRPGVIAAPGAGTVMVHGLDDDAKAVLASVAHFRGIGGL